jgi:hypothetical protein
VRKDGICRRRLGLANLTKSIAEVSSSGFRQMTKVKLDLYVCIVGEKLSAITFVLNYWQLHFDGPTINALTRVQVSADGKVLRDGEDGFRDLICGQIKKTVAEVVVVESQAFTVGFEDGTSISISLKAEDYVGPEAVVFFGPNHTVIIRDGDSLL